MKRFWVVIILLVCVALASCDSYGIGYKTPQEAPNRYIALYTGKLTSVSLGAYWADVHRYSQSKVILDDKVIFEEIQLVADDVQPLVLGEFYTIWEMKDGEWYVITKGDVK